jgi:hypothetical protein
MRYGGEELDTDAQAEATRALVEKLRRCLLHHRRARPRASAPRPSVPTGPTPRSEGTGRHGVGMAPPLMAVAASSADVAEVAAGAEGLYKMTCFSSSVVIDAPEAMTDYDRAVFESAAGGGGGGGSAKSVAASGGSDAAGFKLGETHLDGRRYLMGDGFMVNEKEDAEGTNSQK